MLKSRLQEAEKAVGEDNNSDCVNGSCFVVQSVPERSTRNYSRVLLRRSRRLKS